MYPHFDPEAHLQAYNHLAKRISEEQGGRVGFLETLIAALIAMAITPIALWALAVGLGLGPTV
jgi:hypothetical protein